MNGVASGVLTGEAAYMVAVQGDVLTRAGDREVIRLRTPELRLGVFDNKHRRLVIFDAAALVAMAMLEESPAPSAAQGRTSLLDLPVIPEEKL